MKTAPLTIRTHGAKVKKNTTAAALAAALRKWQKLVPAKERLEIVGRIEEARHRMNNEHLH